MKKLINNYLYYKGKLVNEQELEYLRCSDGKFRFIYKSTNRLNNHYYKGKHITKCGRLIDGYIGSGDLIRLDIKSGNKANYITEIVSFHKTDQELLDAEYKFITWFDLENENCMNKVYGGNFWWKPNKRHDKPKFHPSEGNQHLITFNGETHNIAQWCRIYNVKYNLVVRRLMDGWSFEQAITQKPRISRLILKFDNGDTISMMELIKLTGLSYCGIMHRIKKGMSIEKIITKTKKYDNKKHKIVFNGVEYNSLRQFAKQFNIKPSTLRNRLKAGFTLEQCVSVKNLRGKSFDDFRV